MGDLPKIAVCASRPDGDRVARMIDGLGEVTIAPLERAGEAARSGASDVLVLVSSDEDALVNALASVATYVSTIVVTDTLRPRVSSEANRRGAFVCLFDHGEPPLRAALARAGEESMLFDSAPFGIALLDDEDRVVRGNRAIQQFLGRDQSTLHGHKLTALAQQTKPETVEDLRRSLVDREGEHARVLTRYARPDGQLVDGLESVVWRAGTKVALIEDAHARSMMEAAIRASESVRALVYVSVSDVIFTLRAEGERFRFTEINPAFTRATGLTAEMVVGKFVDEVIPEPSLSLVMSKYREALAERRTVRWEEVTPYPTGKKYGEVSVTPLIDPDGACRTLVGTVHDVTEMRRRDETIRLYADIVRSVDLGITVWQVEDPCDEDTITLTASNPASDRLSGTALSEHLGKPLVRIFPTTKGTELCDLLCDVARDGHTRELRSYRFGRPILRSFALKAFRLEGGSVALAAEDVTSEERARALKAIEQRVLEMIAAGGSLEQTLTDLVLGIEEQSPPAIGSILLLSADGKRVRLGAAPHLPDEFNRAIDGAPIGAAAGSCGTAAYLRRSVIVSNIETDPLWAEYRNLARPHHLRACWSTPIFASDGRVLGTFALYYKEPRTPTAEELAVIARANHVAAIAIQRHELDEQLRNLAARLEMVREEERTAIARDIHDELGQMLTALKMDIAWIGRRAVAPEGIAMDVLRAKLKELTEMTDGLINEVRRIAAELRPGILDDLGLSAAISWQASEFERRTGIECSVDASLADEGIGRELSTTVFRAFQEALTNVMRHAEAHHVEVTLAQTDSTLVLEVKDDGQGIRDEAINDPRSLGLLGIRERARRVGGTAEFRRADPAGTIVTLRLPLAPPSRPA